jgi:hypothetical protein
MTTTMPSLVRRTFRFSVDIETTIKASPRERLGDGKMHERSYQALVQHLLAHPPALRHLLRAACFALQRWKHSWKRRYFLRKSTDGGKPLSNRYSSRSSRNSSRLHKRTSLKRWKTGRPFTTSMAARQVLPSFPWQNETSRRDDRSLCQSPPPLTGRAGHPDPVPVREDSNQ